MERNSSISSFERVVATPARPGNEKAWIVAVAATLAAVLVASWLVLAPATVRHNYMTKAIKALSNETKVLVLGTSHVDCAINPAMTTAPLMNLSGVVCNYVCLEGVLASHIDRLSGLEAVVIEADIVALRYDTLSVLEYDYGLLLDLAPSIRHLHVGPERKWRLYYDRFLLGSKLTAPFLSRRKFAPRDLLERWRARSWVAPEEFWGHGPATSSPGHRAFADSMVPEEDGAAKSARHFRETESGPVPENIDALVRIVRQLRERGVQVILLQLPHHRTYWDSQPAVFTREHALALERLGREFGPEGFLYWDMARAPGFADEDFYDGDHLNARGAAKLTKLLDERLCAVLQRVPTALSSRPPTSEREDLDAVALSNDPRPVKLK